MGTIDGEGMDAGGRFLLPGLWDNHVHFTQWSLTQQWLDLGTAASAREVAALVGEAVPTSSARPFVGIGFRDGLWADAPNLADLDAVSGDVPVVLNSGDLHSVWLNSAALALYGHAGHPTGLLREDDAFRITGLVAALPDDVVDGYALAASRTAAARGVVGIVDLEMSWNLDTWQRRQAAGNDLVRVEFGIYTEHLDRAIGLGLHTGGSLGELLTVGRFKVLTDGSLNTRTAYCYDPYPGTHNVGMLTVPPEELLPLMRKAAAAGIEPTVHAIGDRANTLALDAFESVGCHGRIEHAQLVAAQDFARFAALGVTASVQPEHAMDDRDVADRYWAGRNDRTMALRSLLDAGATLAFGSDAPVAPLDPWVSMSAAVGRARDGREPWHPEQSVSFAEALSASTRSTIAVGQPADLVLVDVDPTTVSPDALRTMPVAATLLAGRFTHTTL
jgi:predicted amidohydrolase YtcJ